MTLLHETLLRFVGVSLVLAVGACGGNTTPNSPTAMPQQPGQAAAHVTVNIPMNAMGMGPAAFGVNPLIIAAGTTVTWVNQDIMPHTTTSDGGVCDSGLLQPGQSFSYPFSGAVNFPYHCQIHGAASMSGMIQVTGGAPAPTPTPSITPLSATYTNVTNNVLVPHCMSCHEGASPSAGLDFTTYQNLVHNPVLPNLVIPGSPSTSRLFIHIQGDAAAVGQEHLTAAQIQLVLDWIQGGAPNN